MEEVRDKQLTAIILERTCDTINIKLIYSANNKGKMHCWFYQCFCFSFILFLMIINHNFDPDPFCHLRVV